LQSFRAAHPGIEILAVWLRPQSVGDPKEYSMWLQRLLHASPPEIRFIIVDLRPAPAFGALAEVEPKRVRTQHADLDMPEALEQVSAAAGDLDTPGGQFRQLYVRMGGTAKRGDFPATEQLASQALTISDSQHWFQLSGAVHFFLGSVLLQLGRNVDAYHRFLLTDEAGAKSDAAREEGAKRIRLNGRMAAGSALLAERAFAPAARVFQETVPLARELGDRRAELDGRRLASYCYEQAGQLDTAWNEGLEGLGVARAMDEEARATSTLRHLAESVLRLCEQPSLRDYQATARRELDALLGRDWQQTPKAAVREAAEV
jgi:tetratricopeptide (TPR) repeat protein